MTYFSLTHNELHVENLPLSSIASLYGTPCYVYSKKALIDAWQQLNEAFKAIPHQLHYAVKANSNLAILHLFKTLGSGFDIVSEGELARVLRVGGDPSKILFSGVGKTTGELEKAIAANVGCINIESESEFLRLEEMVKALNVTLPIAFRINPNIDSKSHPYISTGLTENKFGIPLQTTKELYQKASKNKHFKVKGLAFHIGSQMMSLDPLLNALTMILDFIDELAKEQLIVHTLDIGGGLGVQYHLEIPPTPEEYANAIIKKMGNRKITLHIEPGRVLTAHAGVLLTKIEYIKPGCHQKEKKYFAITDAGMNDLIRPTLYAAWQNILAVKPHQSGLTGLYDIVGPLCESSDFLGKNRELSLKENDLLAIMSSGAYGFSMSSNYNSKPKAAEVMVDGEHSYLIRERETIEDLFDKELIPK